jgi:hypothetical protein
MAPTATRVEKVIWKGRPGFRLSNRIVDLVALTGGGHIAAFGFVPGSGFPESNALWEAPWSTMDPEDYRARHARRYGPEPAGSFLSGFTGHALCLDYFGAPSEEELQSGMRLHGEAAALRWTRVRASGRRAVLTLEAQLPAAGLRFHREVRLGRGESAAYFHETICNERAEDHYCHWVQHVTFGLPLLASGESRIALSGSRAHTWPHGYEGKPMLADTRDFEWPHAPGLDGTMCDISDPFAKPGKGFVAAVLADTRRDAAYIAVLNWRLGIVAGYCFRRQDFPWIAVWEENCARTGPPWNGHTRARGLEFGTTPMPLGKAEAFASGPLFGTPTFRRIPAHSEVSASYVAFVAAVPQSWRNINDVQPRHDALIVADPQGQQVRVSAAGIQRLFAP